MLSFFSNRKPKRFNYKPRYQNDESKTEERERISFTNKKLSNAMYDRYERVPFGDLRKAGRKRLMIKATIITVALLILTYYIDKIEELLKSIE